MNQLLEKLNKLNIKLSLKGDNLDIQAPKGSVTPNILEEIRSHKSEIRVLFNLLPQIRDKFSEEKQKYKQLPWSFNYLYSRVKKRKTANNMSFGFVFKDEYDISKIKAAYIELLNQHRILKSKIESNSNDNILIVENINNTINEVKYDSLDLIYSKIHDLHNSKFQFEKENLLRSFIFYTNSETVFFCSVPHLIFDGISLNIFWRDFFNLYNGNTVDNSKLQFIESLKIRENNTNDTNESYFFWKSILKKKRFSISIHEKEDASNEGSIITKFEIDSIITDKLLLFCKKRKITLNTLFISIISILIKKKCNESFIICFDHHSRQNETMEQIGLWVQNLFIEIDHNTNEEFFFENIHKSVQDAITNSNIDIIKLLFDLFGNDFESKLNNLKQIRFNYYDDFNDITASIPQNITPLYFGNNNYIPSYLHFFVENYRGHINVTIKGNSRYFEEAFLEKMKEDIISICTEKMKIF